MYNLGLRWELRPGDILFSAGRVVSHGVEEVLSGVRKNVDLMVHESTVRWVQRREEEARHRMERQRKRRQRRKRRLEEIKDLYALAPDYTEPCP